MESGQSIDDGVYDSTHGTVGSGPVGQVAEEQAWEGGRQVEVQVHQVVAGERSPQSATGEPEEISYQEKSWPEASR